jgi:hypothetical protein
MSSWFLFPIIIGDFKRKWIKTITSMFSHGWKKAWLMLLNVISIFWPFDVMKRNPLQWVCNSPIVFLPTIDGLSIKSFKIRGCFASYSFSFARCWFSSLASADLWVMESYCFYNFKASLSSPCTTWRFWPPSTDLNVSSLMKVNVWWDVGSKISFATYVGLCKFILRKFVCFSF